MYLSYPNCHLMRSGLIFHLIPCSTSHVSPLQLRSNLHGRKGVSQSISDIASLQGCTCIAHTRIMCPLLYKLYMISGIWQEINLMPLKLAYVLHAFGSLLPRYLVVARTFPQPVFWCVSYHLSVTKLNSSQHFEEVFHIKSRRTSCLANSLSWPVMKMLGQVCHANQFTDDPFVVALFFRHYNLSIS